MTLLRYVPLHARHTNLRRRTSVRVALPNRNSLRNPHLREVFFLPSRRQTKSPDTSITTTLFLLLFSCLERGDASNRCVIVQSLVVSHCVLYSTLERASSERVYFRRGSYHRIPFGLLDPRHMTIGVWVRIVDSPNSVSVPYGVPNEA